ncbi:MAG: glycoside hydrolase family 9 protein [Fibrobacter sp.]|nr:glycoside hydrolase family 9 protein [Fibrobacter sp.]
MKLKKILMTGLACFGLATVDSLAALSTDDYVEAAWMTTRFYGAQRSGKGPNWLSFGTNYTTSFTKDNYQGKDVSGGWFDCGDHVMYGQSQGFSSYILALSYAEFTEGFYDLYTGDYSDYKAANDYTRKGGKPNKIRDLLEELRYEADFWVKAAISSSAFVTVKGDGNADHTKWVTPGKMSTLGSGEGGENRSITGNANDSYTPGMAAAMLAVMARVDPDESNRTKYLAAAKTAYSYSKSHSGVTNSAGFYESSWWDGRTTDGVFLAALELYRTTKDKTYESDAEKYFDKIAFAKGSDTRLNYASAVPLSVVMGQYVLDLSPGGSYRDALYLLDHIYANYEKNSNGIFMRETGGGGSFSVRTPSGGAFLYALYSKLSGDADYDDVIEKNVAYLLGDNSNKKSYVVGFTRNSAKAPTAPHHRGYYANENPDNDVNGYFNVPEKNKLLGGMIAGAFSDGNHSGDKSKWNVNEVCVDLNAPMVGALGYILSKKAPKTDVDLGIKEAEKPADTTKKDTIVSAIHSELRLAPFTMSQSGLEMSVVNGMGESFKVQVFDMQGNKVQEIVSNGSSVSFTLKAKGVLHMMVSSKSFKQAYTVKAL